jgi:hypothetical protein
MLQIHNSERPKSRDICGGILSFERSSFVLQNMPWNFDELDFLPVTDQNLACVYNLMGEKSESP